VPGRGLGQAQLEVRSTSGGLNTSTTQEVGRAEITLQYVDPGTGKQMSARNLIVPPVPLTDWRAKEFETDETDTYSNYNWLDVTVVDNGTNCQLIWTNRATGNLYIHNLQVRGYGLVVYDPMTATAQDADSISAYGRRALSFDMPLSGDVELARSVANYMLSRWKTPNTIVNSVDFGQRISIGTTRLYSLDIGSVIVLSDTQTGIASARHEVIGYELTLSPRSQALRVNLRRLDDVTYGVYSDGTLGKYDTARYGI
jgi:hypothetical protein